jgi:TP901 family phage tail tape measure protein
MKSLQGTMKLAAATQSDLAFTSETVVSTLAAYRLEAEAADRVSNVFAATISGSQATMERLSTALSFVGPVAASVNISLEETSAIMGSLFNAGINASTAGTALRQSIAQLLKPTEDATKALDRLGVVVTNDEGELRNFTDIISDLEQAGLTAADAMAIFGIRAGPAMLALVSKGADAISNLTAEVTDTNKASEMAELQTATFQGKVKLLKSAIEELQISMGNKLLPVLTAYTVKVTDAINATIDWTNANPALIDGIARLGKFMAKNVPETRAVNELFKALTDNTKSAEEAFNDLIESLGGTTEATGEATSAFKRSSTAAKELRRDFMFRAVMDDNTEATEDAANAANVATTAFDNLAIELDKATASGVDFLDQFDQLPTVADRTSESIETLNKMIREMQGTEPGPFPIFGDLEAGKKAREELMKGFDDVGFLPDVIGVDTLKDSENRINSFRAGIDDEMKDRQDKTLRNFQKGERAKEKAAKNTFLAGIKNAKTEAAAQEQALEKRRAQIEDFVGATQPLLAGLFTGLVNQNTLNEWEAFWQEMKDRAIRQLAAIAASEAMQLLVGLISPETAGVETRGGALKEAGKSAAGGILGGILGGVVGSLFGPGGTAIGASIGASIGGKAGASLAEGGIVTRPTVALIGEAGPEAVVPLSGGRSNVSRSSGRPIVIENMPISFPNANLENIDETRLDKVMVRIIPRIQRAIEAGELTT